MASLGSSLRCNTLHSAPITEEYKSVIVNKFISRLVEDSSSVFLSNGKANGIGKSLTKRASCDFYTRCIVLKILSRSEVLNIL